MKNFFYEEQVMEKVKEILNSLTEEQAKNITCGDFSVLPLPEELGNYLPAVIITAVETEPEFANRVSETLYTPYTFHINYIYPYTFKALEDTPRESKKVAYTIANLFLNNRTLGDLEIPRGETEAGGKVLDCMITKIDFNPAENTFFTALEIPASVAEITLEVDFRTYQK